MPARTGSILGGLGRSNSGGSNHDRQESNLVNPPRPSISPAPSPRLQPQSASSISSQPSMEHIKRHSLSGLVKGHDKKDKKDKKHGSPALRPTIPRNEIELAIESPPNVFYGSPERSQGALMSGILRVNIVDPEITLHSFTGNLYCRITPKKPIAKDCVACAYKDTTLKEYTFLSESKTLAHGSHRFPFSHLFSGHLPASTTARLFSIQYFLSARAVPANNSKTTTPSPTTSSPPQALTLTTEIITARSLAVPAEKISTRVFPPTRLEVQLSMPPIIHPIGRWICNFRLTRALNPPPPTHHKTELQTRCKSFKDFVHHQAEGSVLADQRITKWLIRRLLWHLEEKESCISPACSKHAAKVGGDGRGKEHEEVRTLAKEDLHDGFKADYTTPGPDAGSVEIEFPIVLTAQRGGAKRALCDVTTPTGISLKHLLTVEIIIAEEWVDNIHAPKRTGATGQARILRAQFGVVITERAGLGISWEDEEPPTYEDVPSSVPPDYEGVTGLPPLSAEAREELVRRARAAFASGLMSAEAGEAPQSPPLYGVNSSMDEFSGRPIEEVMEGLSLTGGAGEGEIGRSGVRRGGWREEVDGDAGTLHPVEAAERARERGETGEGGVAQTNGVGVGASGAARDAAAVEEDMVGVGEMGVVEDVG